MDEVIQETKVQEEKKEEKINLEFSKLTLWQIISSVLGILLVVSIFTNGFNLFKSDSGTGAVVVDNEQVATKVLEVSAEDDAILGNKDAKIQIISFSDYQCPFCRKFWTETLTKLKTNYIDNNKVSFVFRDFPLDFHQSAKISAEAAECAREQGGDKEYWEMHDKIFEEQNILDSGDPKGQVTKTAQYTIEDIKKWATAINLDADKLSKCIESGKYDEEIQKDMAEFTRAGGALNLEGIGTPSFFVIADKKYADSDFSSLLSMYPANVKLAENEEGNTVLFISGALPYDAFDAILSKLV